MVATLATSFGAAAAKQLGSSAIREAIRQRQESGKRESPEELRLSKYLKQAELEARDGKPSSPPSSPSPSSPPPRRTPQQLLQDIHEATQALQTLATALDQSQQSEATRVQNILEASARLLQASRETNEQLANSTQRLDSSTGRSMKERRRLRQAVQRLTWVMATVVLGLTGVCLRSRL